MKTVREENELLEKKVLSPFAALSSKSKGRLKRENKCELRTEFQRDRDRIIHAKSFRRLRYKTQVFLAPKGDHYRTRLTHTLEVSQISRVISRALRLNEDLTEAIALGHDLGHTPFGHAGETVLNRLLKKGFRHNEQSVRVVDYIEKDGKGLNLTFEVRDGILRHSKGKGDIFYSDKATTPATKEGEVVRVSDLVAYLSHDLDDALRAKVIKESQLPASVRRYIGETHSSRINTMVKDIINVARKSDSLEIAFSNDIYENVLLLRDFMYKNVYESDKVHGEFYKAERILEQLFLFFLENQKIFNIESENQYRGTREEKVADFISGMTDRYLLSLFEKYFVPSPWGIF